MAASEEEKRSLYPLNPNSYCLLHEIGRGTSAVVYKAHCLPLNSAVVAIKSIDLDRSKANLDHIRHEAKSLALLSHPNVLRAHCSFTVDHRLWVVMPLMSAGSLQSIITSSHPNGLTEPSIAVILRETLRALSYLHGQGLVHRDIKAGNILLDSDGSVKLADFGVSASLYDNSTQSLFNEMTGTPYWMAPEVIHSDTGYGTKADIWSLGITALELAHGRPPLYSDSIQMRITKFLHLDDANTQPFKINKKQKLSKAFKEFVSSCLALDPSKRPTAEKLIRHSFFKNSKPTNYLIKAVLQAMPPLEERFMIALEKGSCSGEAEVDMIKSRRISGWDFTEGARQLNSFYPSDIKDDGLPDARGEREEELVGIMRSLQNVVDDLGIQLGREVRTNAYLEETLERLRRKEINGDQHENND